MMSQNSLPLSKVCRLLLLTFFLLPALAMGQTWNAAVGAQSPDKARQVQAFLPNEIWVHAGDTVTWTVNTDEIHTITFLQSGQVRLPFNVGCPGFSPSGLSFDGSTCVSAPPLAKGQTFSVTFPTPGNYKLTCLVHEDMTGVVHVLDSSAILPHNQAYYDRKGADEARELLADRDEGRHTHMGARNSVTVGMGEVVATGGGHHSISVMRFVHRDTVIHVGDTVEWTNDDPVTPHTITFGEEPANPIPPSNNVTVDVDGARHAIINSPSDSVHSGFIVSAPQERIGLPQAPLGATRFRVTFTSAGVYPYICALHDTLGMTGKIIVLPW
jgi:plastocyanin